MHKNYKITVCVPTYNRYKDLSNLIQTFLNQDYRDSNLLILDDLGSSNIEKIAMRWMKKSKRIKYKKNKKNLGYSNNMRQAFQFADGDIIVFMGDDDIFVDNHALSLISKAFNKSNIGVAKASQIIFKNGRVNQVYPLKQHKPGIIYYKKGKDTYENLWFESLSISGLAFRNTQFVKELVNNSITLYPQVELMGLVCLTYGSAEINKHIIGVQSHSGQLNCVTYTLNGKMTNIVEDWLNIFFRIQDYAIDNNLSFINRNNFIDNFSRFIYIFFPYNSLNSGRASSFSLLKLILKYNKEILYIPGFWAVTISSLFLPDEILKFLMEKIKRRRLLKILNQDEIKDYNYLLSSYY